MSVDVLGCFVFLFNTSLRSYSDNKRSRYSFNSASRSSFVRVGTPYATKGDRNSMPAVPNETRAKVRSEFMSPAGASAV